jgi:hypothetical protein
MKADVQTRLNTVTEKTLFPLSIILILIAVAVHFTSIKNVTESNRQAIKELKESDKFTKTRIYDRLHKIDNQLSNISGKMEIFLQKKAN